MGIKSIPSGCKKKFTGKLGIIPSGESSSLQPDPKRNRKNTISILPKVLFKYMFLKNKINYLLISANEQRKLFINIEYGCKKDTDLIVKFFKYKILFISLIAMLALTGCRIFNFNNPEKKALKKQEKQTKKSEKLHQKDVKRHYKMQTKETRKRMNKNKKAAKKKNRGKKNKSKRRCY
jgi:hypothetical protein